MAVLAKVAQNWMFFAIRAVIFPHEWCKLLCAIGQVLLCSPLNKPRRKPGSTILWDVSYLPYGRMVRIEPFFTLGGPKHLACKFPDHSSIYLSGLSHIPHQLFLPRKPLLMQRSSREVARNAHSIVKEPIATRRYFP